MDNKDNRTVKTLFAVLRDLLVIFFYTANVALTYFNKTASRFLKKDFSGDFSFIIIAAVFAIALVYLITAFTKHGTYHIFISFGIVIALHLIFPKKYGGIFGGGFDELFDWAGLIALFFLELFVHLVILRFKERADKNPDEDNNT